MIGLNTGSAAGLWDSALDSTAAVAAAAERAAGQALGPGAPWQDLAAGSMPILLALAIGLALWLVGDRLFRPASSLIGAGVGAVFGLWASTIIPADTLGSIPTAYVTIGTGSLLGLAIGAAMYRLAIGTAGGVVFGCLAAALTIAVSLHTTSPLDRNAAVPERPETIAEAAAMQAAATDAAVLPAAFGTEISADRLRETATAARSFVDAGLAALPEQFRPLALAAAILGCVLGFAAGLLKPRTIGPAVAALAGAALWLGATTFLLARTGHALPAPPTQQPAVWLAAWLGVAAIGFIVQRRVGRSSDTTPG
ncbi:MAG: hypothetical protein Q9O74_00620 [Planctomycetota bacterium]|nr:hypothetical protein [Planctomycetota bacterium]